MAEQEFEQFTGLGVLEREIFLIFLRVKSKRFFGRERRYSFCSATGIYKIHQVDMGASKQQRYSTRLSNSRYLNN